MEKFTAALSESVLSITACVPPRVLVTVPHDGARSMDLAPFIPHRTRGIMRRDVGTWPISRDVLHSFPVNLVRGMMPRSHLEYNDAVSNAYESQQFAASYSAYHGMIFHHLSQMTRAFGIENLLVLDVHNFPHQPVYASRGTSYDLILGTKYRSTILYGEPDRAFAAFMEARGYSVYLPSEDGPVRGVDRRDWFDGGFTVCDVAKRHKVNALQIEIDASKFCTRNSAVAGTRLSADIAAFLRENYSA